MVVDSLTHITFDGKWFNTNYNASAENLLFEMDNAKVDYAVVVALADYIENSDVLKICNKYNDRLLPGASINPGSFRDLKEVKKAVLSLCKNEPFKVLKLHPRLNKYDPLDLRCLAVFEAVSELDNKIPIWIDSFFRTKGVLLKKPTIDTVHVLLEEFSEVSTVLLHGAGSLAIEAIDIIKQYENAYIDLSYSFLRFTNTSFFNDFIFCIKHYDRKTIIGSDFPEFKPSMLYKELLKIEEKFQIEKFKINNVCGDNLNRLLLIED